MAGWLRHLPAIVITLLIILLALQDWSPVALPRERVDGLLYDLKVRHLPPWPESVINVQIVDIDEASLNDIGRMPWSREHFASLITKLVDQGALVICMDILFSEAQENAAQPVIDALQRSNVIDPTLRSQLLKQFDRDRQFSQAMENAEVVLPVLLHRETGKSGIALQRGYLPRLSVNQNRPALPGALFDYPGYAGLLPSFAKVSAGQGYMNAFEDADGFVRRTALLARVNDELIPSLALEAFRVYSLLEQVNPVWEVNAQQAYLTAIQVGNQYIATDHQARILIPYRGGAKTYPYTSAKAVLTDDVKDNRFDQAVVFVGTSATGLADLRATPVGLGFPGVEIQATIFDALANPAAIPTLPEWWREAILLELLLIGLVSVIWLSRRTPLRTTLYAFAIVTLVVTTNLTLWWYGQLALPLFSPLLLSVLLAVLYISSGFFTESRQRKKVKAIFDQYVPPAHIDRILAAGNAQSLEGEKKELSVLFSDIRSFTSISETMSASELKLWLNQFFTPVTQAIFEQGGTIDKYVGDMVMAFWGAPLDEPRHASKAVAAAFAMLKVLGPLNQAFEKAGRPVANIGIGINTGEMNVGDMGSDFRRSYTVIGDAVNLGSRLEGLTKFYGVQVLVSEFTKRQATDFHYLLVDKVRVKGKEEPVTLFSPLPPQATSQQLQQADTFNQVMALYFESRFSQALGLLDTIATAFPNQTLVSLYQQRIAAYIETPPPVNWDGSFTHKQK